MGNTNATRREQNGTAVLNRNQLVLFTYPESFNAVANSLQFLPEESRVQALVGLVMTSPSM
jgi:hypothetical protein